MSPLAGRAALIVKLLGFAAILIALTQPVVTLPGVKVAAVVLVDTSKSITSADLGKASGIVSQMERSRGSNWLRVVPFASTIAPEARLVPASGSLGDATNLEAALTSTMAAVPAGYLPRVVLLSDGNENEGSISRAIAELRQLHVPVDTIPLSGRPATSLRLESISLPHIAYAGESIPIDLTVDSPAAVSASLELSAEGKPLGSNPVDLQRGTNTLRVHARVKTSGATSISGRLHSADLGDVAFEQAIEMRRAKVLYLSQDPPGTELNLTKIFEQGSFDLTRDTSLIDHDLSSVNLIVLNNLDLEDLNLAAKQHVEEFVKRGGGLLLIGGERQVYKADKRLDALDRALPAKLAPPKSPEGTSVVLIIDKSSSMEGRKIELARISAIGVVDHLRPIDNIGVLIFDNSFQWAVPMRHAEDKSLIKRLISGITPDGGTQIAPALTEAYRKVLPTKAVYKHIVLLTDGISEEGDSVELARKALENDVTISTVGLGQDVNRAYLEKVASTSNGRSYFLNEPQGLEQILLKDVQEYSGGTAVERMLTPIVDRQAEVLRDVGMDQAPALKGYARFEAKPGAETILSIDAARKDPLFVRWQYGLGRAAVFSSDAKSRWAANWITWPGFDKFWLNVTRDLLTHTDPSEATAQFDAANSDVVVTYRLAAAQTEPAVIPQIFVLGPAAFEMPMAVRKTAPHVYQGRLHIPAARGLYRIRPLADSPAFPEIGLYRQQEEFQDYGSNEPLLKQVSNLTGGVFDPPVDTLFSARGRSLPVTWQLWPALLGLAIVLNLAELILRKWRGLVESYKARVGS